MPPQDPQDKNTCDPNDPNDGNEGNQGSASQSGASDPSDDSDPTPTPEATQAAQDNDETSEEKDNTPAPAPVTNDSHRVTIYVPHEEETVFNLGMGAPTGEETIADDGITGRTKSHVHFHTTEGETKTMVAVGGGTTEGWASHGGTNLLDNRGFMVVTASNNWLESAEQWYGLSTGADATLRALTKRVVIQADADDINLVAGKGVLASAPGITLAAPATITPLDINYVKEWEGPVAGTNAGGVGSAVGALMAILNSVAEGVAMARHKVWTHYKIGTKTEKMDTALSVAKAIAEAGEIGASLVEIVEVFSNEEAEGGTIKLNADKHASMFAKKMASVAASGSASLSGGVWATMAAGVSASVKAGISAGMSAALASVAGLRKVELISDFGEIEIEGQHEVVVSSHGNVHLQSHGKNVGCDATVGVLLRGTANVTIGAGSGAGMGLIAKEDTLSLGAMTDANDLSKMAVKTDSYMTFDSQGWRILQSGGCVKIETNGDVTLANKNMNAGVALLGSNLALKSNGRITLQ